MASHDPDELWPKLKELGLEEVQKKLAQGVYGASKKPVVEQWVEKEKKALDAPTYMYHPIVAPDGKIFTAKEVPELEKNGWFDSPSKFPKNASEAKTLILSALKDFNEKRPSQHDFVSLIDVLNIDTVQITDMDFARSVINSLFEDKYIAITGDKSKPNQIGIRITELGIKHLSNIDKINDTKSHPSIHRPDTFTGKVMVIVVASTVMIIIGFVFSEYIFPKFQKSESPKKEISIKDPTSPKESTSPINNNEAHIKKKDTEPPQKKEVSEKPMLTEVVPPANNQNLRNNKFLLQSDTTKELFDGGLTITLTSLLNFSNSDIDLSLSKKGLQAKTYTGIKIGQKIFYEGYEITFMETKRNITHYDALLRIIKL